MNPQYEQLLQNTLQAEADSRKMRNLAVRISNGYFPSMGYQRDSVALGRVEDEELLDEFLQYFLGLQDYFDEKARKLREKVEAIETLLREE